MGKVSSIFFWRRARSRFATGGTVPWRDRDDGSIPVMLSPGRSTYRRPGETWSQAMNRLTEGTDL